MSGAKQKVGQSDITKFFSPNSKPKELSQESETPSKDLEETSPMSKPLKKYVPLQKVKKENINPNSEKMFKQGDVVWVNLGFSYSWWPGEFQELSKSTDKKISDLDVKINVSDNPLFSKSGKQNHQAVENKLPKREIVGHVRFFDDDKHDLYRVTNPDDICPYSCKEKQEYVVRGLAKFSSEVGESTTTNSGFDFRARQAQFYKDVEMAEVITDNDIEIANILAEFYVVDEAPKPPPKKKRRKRRN